MVTQLLIFSRLFRSTKLTLYLLYSVSLTPLRLHLNILAWFYLSQNVFPTECSSTVKHQVFKGLVICKQEADILSSNSPVKKACILVHYGLILLKVCCFPPSLFLSLDPKLTRSRCSWKTRVIPRVLMSCLYLQFVCSFILIP